jgi:RNA polymerase sigma-70 factor (ECF subfamily)
VTDITSPSAPSDSSIELDSLILAIANQDLHALQTLYCQHRRSIFAVAYAITHDCQLSEDALQDTIIRIWENAANYRQGSNAQAWIHTITRNLSLDIVRQRRQTVSIDDYENRPMPEQLITRTDSDDRMLLESGLNDLTPEQALVFVLKVIVGLSHLETAKMLDMPYRLVRFRYHQAISRLKKFLSVPDENAN